MNEPEAVPRLRILYVGSLAPTATSLHRRWALERLGHEVVEFNTLPYDLAGGPLLIRVRNRTLVGWTVEKLNRDLLRLALSRPIDLVWFDRSNYVHARTVAKLRQHGIFTVQYAVDNPFGPRNDPGWRLLLKAIPEYDLHLVQRDVNLDDYRKARARDILLFRTAYEPTIHFSPPTGWSDRDRSFDVVYIGSPYDNRAEFLVELWKRHGIRTAIWGTKLWEGKLNPDAKAALLQGTERWNDIYRETIWRSRICLSFVTHSNCDDVAHKSFEIAACGGFLLAEDWPGHRAHFTDGEEAAFFRSVDDCAAKIRRYLPDEAARTRIGRAAHRRAESSGYGNDARISAVLRYVVKTRFRGKAR